MDKKGKMIIKECMFPMADMGIKMDLALNKGYGIYESVH
jgi:hypothetical protein